MKELCVAAVAPLADWRVRRDAEETRARECTGRHSVNATECTKGKVERTSESEEGKIKGKNGV